MPGKPLDTRELGYYFTLAQVGMEMAVPVAVGVFVDRYLEWGPWGVVAGASLGLCTGLVHLVVMSNRRDDSGDGKPKQGPK